MKVTMKIVTEWLVTDLLHYRHFCCYIIDCYIIGKFRSYIIGAYFVTLSGDFDTLSVSCYIIGKFRVTVSVDVSIYGVVTLSGVTPSIKNSVDISTNISAANTGRMAEFAVTHWL